MNSGGSTSCCRTGAADSILLDKKRPAGTRWSHASGVAGLPARRADHPERHTNAVPEVGTAFAVPGAFWRATGGRAREHLSLCARVFRYLRARYAGVHSLLPLRARISPLTNWNTNQPVQYSPSL
jgi:hypothetical protein